MEKQRFTDNGDGTITDSSTGLMWQKEDDGRQYAWDQAVSYAQSLNLAGHSDWRLPTVQELVSILDYGRYNPAIDPIFSNAKSSTYCSGTTDASDTGNAWDVAFSYGGVDYHDKSNGGYVRCVRGGRRKREDDPQYKKHIRGECKNSPDYCQYCDEEAWNRARYAEPENDASLKEEEE